MQLVVVLAEVGMSCDETKFKFNLMYDILIILLRNVWVAICIQT